MSEQNTASAMEQVTKTPEYDYSEYKALLDDEMEQVQDNMRMIASNNLSGTKVGEVLADSFRSRGKMIRPRLVLLCSSFGPLAHVRRDRICLLAAMIEMTHLASLIHDDIVDDAPFRRGERSIQSKYGKDSAVYAGDFVITRVNYFMMREGLNEAGAVIAKTIERMCEGEIGQAMCRYREDVTTDDYLWNIQGKTTALFRSSCRIGAAEAGCPKEVIAKLSDFGECLGTLFQLRDDLLDFTSDEAAEGKETHKDFRDGIYTMPVLLAMRDPGGKEALLPLIRENARHRLSDEQIAQMEEAVIRFGGTEQTRREIQRMNGSCLRILDEMEKSGATVLLRKILKLLEV